MSELYSVLNEIRVLDEKIKNIFRRKNNNPEEVINIRKNLILSEQKIKEKKAELDRLKKQDANFSGLIESDNVKVIKAEEKLKAIKNNREYQAAMKEVSSFKRNVKNYEKEKENLKPLIEALNKEIEGLEKEQKEKSNTYEKILIKMKDDNNVLDKEITDINTLKKEKLKTMPKNLIESYVKIYQKKQGSGIALIKEGKCNVCNMTLPKQICNEISKKDRIIYCPSCQRIVISIDI